MASPDITKKNKWILHVLRSNHLVLESYPAKGSVVEMSLQLRGSYHQVSELDRDLAKRSFGTRSKVPRFNTYYNSAFLYKTENVLVLLTEYFVLHYFSYVRCRSSVGFPFVPTNTRSRATISRRKGWREKSSN